MKYFAKLDSSNKVIDTFVVDDSDVNNYGGDQSQEAVNHIKSFLKIKNNIVQYSIDGSFRQRTASIDGSYDSNKNVFINEKPYPSWTLDSNNEWQAPVAYPTITTNMGILWDEVNQRWLGEEYTEQGLVNKIWNPNTLSWDNA